MEELGYNWCFSIVIDEEVGFIRTKEIVAARAYDVAYTYALIFGPYVATTLGVRMHLREYNEDEIRILDHVSSVDGVVSTYGDTFIPVEYEGALCDDYV